MPQGKGRHLFKRILLTAVLGGGLLFTVPGMAQANPHTDHSAKVRHDHPGQHYDGGSTTDWGSGWWEPGYGGLGYVGFGPGYERPPATWGNGYIRPGVYEYHETHAVLPCQRP